ncbi:MAG: hypothetical protein RR350_02020 [Oscillibacter sp.]
MHINEVYEHAPILPYQPEEACPLSGCTKTVTKCVDIAARVVMSPTAVLGPTAVACQGGPTVTCVVNSSGTSGTITLTQRVCVTLPVQYGVSVTGGESTIACAGV